MRSILSDSGRASARRLGVFVMAAMPLAPAVATAVGGLAHVGEPGGRVGRELPAEAVLRRQHDARFVARLLQRAL